MKYTTFLVIAPLLLGACDTTQSVTEPVSGPAFAANKTTFEEDVPFFFEGPNPCVEDGTEIVSLSGTLHITMTEKFRDNGSFVLETETEPVDVTGTGFPSGATYTASGGFTQTLKVKANTAVTETLTDIFKVKSNDGGTDFTLVVTQRVSVSKDGEVTAEPPSFEVKCHG